MKNYIKRDLEEKILQYINAPEIIAVIGPRQSGKSTLVEHIFADLPDSNRLTLEDASLFALFEEDIKAFAQLHIEGYRYVFIDEIQYAPSMGKNLKYLFDTYKSEVKLFISGSSATDFYLKGLKFLVGRVFVFHLYPLSFREFLRQKNERLLALVDNAAVQNEINKHVQEFVIFGGYPRVALAKSDEEKKIVLKNLYNLLIQREITSLAKLLDQRKMIKLVRLLAAQTGGLLNYNNLAVESGLSNHELRGSLNLLEKTFTIHRLTPFFTNKKLEVIKNPKIYFIDTGLRNAIIEDFSSLRPDRGVLYESFVYEELLKAGLTFHYWRSKSKAEVDFIVKRDHHVVPIEVKAGQPQITRSFRSFIQRYAPETAYIVNSVMQEQMEIASSLVQKIFFSQMVDFEEKVRREQ